MKGNFLIQGLGYQSFAAFKTSAFGAISTKAISISAILSCIKTLFGVDWIFTISYVLLILLEWWTGIRASLKKGERHESRKLGRMLFKITIYSLLLFILNSFHSHVNFPVIQGYEVDPFTWLYWVVLFVIIWQLLVSVLENLDALGFKWAKKLIGIININVEKKLGLKE